MIASLTRTAPFIGRRFSCSFESSSLVLEPELAERGREEKTRTPVCLESYRHAREGVLATKEDRVGEGVAGW